MLSEQISREKPYSFYNLVKQESTNSKALDSSTSYSTLDSLSEKLPKSQTFYRFIDGSIIPFTLTISEDNLVISGKNYYTFSYDDILGATVKQVDFSKADKIPELWKKKRELYQLRIYFLLKNPPQDNQKNSQYLEREYQKVKFYIENKTLAMQWKNLILHAANDPDFLNIWKSNGLEDLPPFKRLLLVFVNPRSGNQKGNKVWSKAKKLLLKAGCEFVEVFTKESGFAREYIKQYNSSQLKEIDGFVTVSGDGLLHEIINGLYRRPDWEDFSDIPFGIIPSGTSNSLIRNLVERKKDVANAENACLIIAKGKKFKADLTSLERHDGSKIFSFLIFAWSTMAEIDVGSNHLRALGKFRFTVNGIWNILLLKEYRAKVAFSTNNAEIPSIHEEIQVGQGWEIIHDNFGHFSLHNVSWIETNYQVVPHADLQDGHNHLLTLKGDGVSRVRVGSALAKFKGQLFNGDKPHESLKVGYEKIKAFRIEPLDDKPSYYDIDGEFFKPYQATKIQGRVLEKTLTLYGG